MKTPNIGDLSHLKTLSWEDVLDIWRKGEEGLEHWIKFWEEKGFSSWREWRQQYIDYLELDKIAGWHLYKINNPMKSVPSFRGGPYVSWRERHYKDGTFATFREIVQHPHIRNHDVVNEMIEHFPEETHFVGLITEQGVVIIEGMHRCCALALAAEKKKNIQTNAVVALAEVSAEQLWEKLRERIKSEKHN